MISCSDGSSATCNAGTRDCYSGSDLYCPLVYSGLGENCEGFNESTGLPFPSCDGGLECMEDGDGSSIPGANYRCVEELIEVIDIVGAPTEIICDHGPNAFCSPHPDCYDNSPVYCDQPIVGGLTTITCEDGSVVECNAGTADCYDGSEALCGSSDDDADCNGYDDIQVTNHFNFAAPIYGEIYCLDCAPEDSS